MTIFGHNRFGKNTFLIVYYFLKTSKKPFNTLQKLFLIFKENHSFCDQNIIHTYFLNFIPAHKKDRNFLDNLMNVVSWLFAKNNLNSTISLSDIHLVTAMGVYGRKILRSMNATFTNPFEVVSENVIFGLDEVGAKGKEE